MLLLAAAVFVGNGACQPCHASIWRDYASTPMARSSGRVEKVPPGSFLHGPSGIRYEVTETGEVRDAGRVPRKLAWFVGSGAEGTSYLVENEGSLFEAPVTWYARKKRWDMSPGYQGDRTADWSRAIEPSCLYCHASQVTPVYGTRNRYTDPPFKQGGVACERCHGAGSEHVASNGKSPMVNPARLEARRRDDTCRQCHLSGEARIARPGRQFAEYRAGDLLSRFVSYFVFDTAPGGRPLETNSHVERLLESRCQQASGDRLWCGTCHDPHRLPAQPAAWFREKCLACHQPDPCRRGPDCASCHMPRSQAVDAGGHGVFTDHAIPRRPSAAPRVSAAGRPWKLRPFLPEEAGDREMGLAHAELFGRTRDERHRREAMRLLGPGVRVE